MKLETYAGAARHFNVSVLSIFSVARMNNTRRYRDKFGPLVDLDELIKIDKKKKIRPLSDIIQEVIAEK